MRHIRTKSLFVKYVDIVVSIYAFFNESGSINNIYVKCFHGWGVQKHMEYSKYIFHAKGSKDKPFYIMENI